MESNLCEEKIGDLVGYFLGEIYKGYPPSQEQADIDTRYLVNAIKQTFDDWVMVTFDGENE